MTVSIKALVVARGDVTTAVALVQMSGPVNVFVGTLTAGLPAFLVVSVIVFGYLQPLSQTGRAARPAYFYSVLLCVLIVILVVAPFFYALALLIVAYQFFVMNRLPAEEDPAVTRFHRVLAALMAAAGAALFLSSRLWLPLERVDLGEDEPFVGYVLREGDRWVVLLEEDRRELTFVEDDQIDSREPCASPGPPGRSVVQIVVDLFGEASAPPDYERCLAR